MRPKQWTKNIFIFAGILFSQNLFCAPLLLKSILAFLIFCVLSGAAYLLNDVADLKEDRNHPLKAKRPLASGRLKTSHALGAFALLSLLSLVSSWGLDFSFFLIALGYFSLQITYSFFLKHRVIIDAISVALGFVLRVVAGAVVIDVTISSWLIVCTILLALFLALSKRRHELIVLNEEARSHRIILREYTPYLLDQMISVVTASTLVAYCLYTISDTTIEKFGTKNLVLTVPFVLYGIFRYLYLIHRKEAGGSPENTFITDKPLLFDIFLWVMVVGIILYW